MIKEWALNLCAAASSRSSFVSRMLIWWCLQHGKTTANVHQADALVLELCWHQMCHQWSLKSWHHTQHVLEHTIWRKPTIILQQKMFVLTLLSPFTPQTSLSYQISLHHLILLVIVQVSVVTDLLCLGCVIDSWTCLGSMSGGKAAVSCMSPWKDGQRDYQQMTWKWQQSHDLDHCKQLQLLTLGVPSTIVVVITMTTSLGTLCDLQLLGFLIWVVPINARHNNQMMRMQPLSRSGCCS